MHHWRNGWFFQRTEDGGVLIRQTSDGKDPQERTEESRGNALVSLTIPADEWASIVASNDMSANGQPKIQVTCPGCQTVFSIAFPKVETLNGLFSSAVVGAHPHLSKCIACGQQFLMVIAQAQIQWAVQPVGADIAQQVEGTSLITPSIVVQG